MTTIRSHGRSPGRGAQPEDLPLHRAHRRPHRRGQERRRPARRSRRGPLGSIRSPPRPTPPTPAARPPSTTTSHRVPLAIRTPAPPQAARAARRAARADRPPPPRGLEPPATLVASPGSSRRHSPARSHSPRARAAVQLVDAPQLRRLVAVERHVQGAAAPVRTSTPRSASSSAANPGHAPPRPIAAASSASSPQLASPTGAIIPAATSDARSAPPASTTSTLEPAPRGAPGAAEADHAGTDHDQLGRSAARSLRSSDILVASGLGRPGSWRVHPCAGIARIRFGRSAAPATLSAARVRLPLTDHRSAGRPVARDRRSSTLPADGDANREASRRARLYFVCDRRGRPATRSTRCSTRALRGGVDLIQLRDKDAAEDALLAAAPPFREAADRHGALFLINDRPDLVAAAAPTASTSARTTSRVAEARRLAGPDAIVGLSTHSPEQLDAAHAAAGGRPSRLPQRRPRLGDADEARPPGRRPRLRPLRRRGRARSPGSRSAGSTPTTSPRSSRPAHAGSSSSGRSATPPIPARRARALRHAPRRRRGGGRVSSRERKRAERRKRKQRSGEARRRRRGAPTATAEAHRERREPRRRPRRRGRGAGSAARRSATSARARSSSRSRRASGPRVVTIGAVISAADRGQHPRSPGSPAPRSTVGNRLERAPERLPGLPAGDPLRGDGLRDVAGALLGRARLPGDHGDHHDRRRSQLIAAAASSRRSRRARPDRRRVVLLVHGQGAGTDPDAEPGASRESGSR